MKIPINVDMPGTASRMDVDKSDPAYHATEKDIGNPGCFFHKPVRPKPTTTSLDFEPAVPDRKTRFLLAGRDELARDLGIADRSVSPCFDTIGCPDISQITVLQGQRAMSVIDVAAGRDEKGRFVGGRE